MEDPETASWLVGVAGAEVERLERASWGGPRWLGALKCRDRESEAGVEMALFLNSRGSPLEVLC